MNIYSKKQRWKWVLSVVAILIIITSLWYTQSLVKRIAEEEEKARQAEAIRIQKYQQELNARLGPIHEHGQHLTKWKSGATIFLSLLFYPVGILLFLHSFYHAFQIRSIAQTAGDSEYRSLANIIFTIGLILIGILVFALCIGFISAMSSGY